MRVLTDDPELARTLVPECRTESWQRDAKLDAPLQLLVDALGGTLAWTQDVEPGHPFWSTIVVQSHSEGSQFDALERWLRSGARRDAPVACIALAGTRFRGQHDRTWEAARGNLHVSVTTPVGVDAPRLGAGLSMLPAVAAVDAIVAASDGAVRPAIKWVNDLMLRERKAGGVLTTAHSTSTRIDDVVWGIGINLEVAPAVEPTPFVPATACVRDMPGGDRVTLPRLFHALLHAIAARHAELLRDGSDALLSAYRHHSAVIGRAVRIWEERGTSPLVEGVVAGIDPDLGLRIEGQDRRVRSGRLALIPAAPPQPDEDPAVVAAISAMVSARFPGARVVRVEAEAEP